MRLHTRDGEAQPWGRVSARFVPTGCEDVGIRNPNATARNGQKVDLEATDQLQEGKVRSMISEANKPQSCQPPRETWEQARKQDRRMRRPDAMCGASEGRLSGRRPAEGGHASSL